MLSRYTYFFKKGLYYRFDDRSFKVDTSASPAFPVPPATGGLGAQANPERGDPRSCDNQMTPWMLATRPLTLVSFANQIISYVLACIFLNVQLTNPVYKNDPVETRSCHILINLYSMILSTWECTFADLGSLLSRKPQHAIHQSRHLRRAVHSPCPTNYESDL